ncbi:MAG TPA: glycosyltransferase family 2 protein [Anaerolineales bacterium]|nr:glycosyltransferase family 2 protein [Anaerolineales bacterium]
MPENSITLILPAYNEEEALPPLLDAIAAVRASALPNLSVIVVDDGSKDNTAQVVRDFNQPRAKLVQHPRNMGLAQAMRSGIAAALETSPPDGLIASMDADNSHQPHELTLMLDKLNTGLDVVIASRFRPGAKMQGIPPHRQLFSNVLSILFRLFAPIPGVKDYSCGYRLYRASALRRAADQWGDRFITEQGFACMTEILLKLSLLPGLKFGESPMDLRYDRKPGASKMKVWQNIKDTLALVWRHRWRNRD